MIGVGIDVAKAKSMVAILSDDEEIIKNPFEIANTESGLEYLCNIIRELTDKVYCVVESTSIYHFPVVSYLQKNYTLQPKTVSLCFLTRYLPQ